MTELCLDVFARDAVLVHNKDGREEVVRRTSESGRAGERPQKKRKVALLWTDDV